MKHGEIIQLGRHKLMCGDATSREDVMHLIGTDHVDLVLTDPPYGMKTQGRDGTIGERGKKPVNESWRGSHKTVLTYYPKARKYPILYGDDSVIAAKSHWQIIRDITPLQIIWGGQYFSEFLPPSGGWIFWDKLTGQNDFSDGELAWCSCGKRVRKYTQRWCGAVLACNCKLNAIGGRNKRDTKPRIHPTQKPVELHMKILEDFTKPDDVILDCFGGSGTTLIACNETGRKCLMMEISPDYCDIIVERYDKLTQGSINF